MNPKDEGLFRKDAIEHYLSGEEGGSPIRVSPPWTWALFWTLAAALAVALVVSMTGRVEVTARGRGILLPTPGIQVLTSPMGGTVADVYVRSGQTVRSGEILLRLDSANLQSQLFEAQRALEMLESDYQAFSVRQDHFYAEQEAGLRSRAALMQDQVASQAKSLGLYERKLAANRELHQDGLVSDIVVAEAAEALAQAQRQLGSTRQSLVQVNQELASLQANREDELWQREYNLRQAQAKRDALKFSISQTEVKAPVDASVESILAKPGDFVQTGQALGRLVPEGTPLRVVAFLPERDRAFVKTGEEARLELDQLPYAEFGTLKARILRIAGDLASSQEIQEAMGDADRMNGAFYRVDLGLEASPHALKVPLRTGMLMNVRFTLRTQRPITLFFEPLRRWLN